LDEVLHLLVRSFPVAVVAIVAVVVAVAVALGAGLVCPFLFRVQQLVSVEVFAPKKSP